jgi:hypothetical protein
MGPAIIVIVLVVVIPVAVLLSGMVAAAIFSFLFPKDAEDNAANPELIELS